MAISKLILNGEVQMDVTSDTVTAGSMLSGTTATKNDGTKATGTIANKSSSDLTVSGATVTAPAGYYANAASKAIATATHPNPSASIASSTGVVTASHTQSTGYVTGGTTTGTLSLTTQAGKTITPTETAQTAVASYRWTTGPISVAAIDSYYIGSRVPQNSAADVTIANTTGVVTAPAGYYSTAATKTLTTKAGETFYPSTADQTISSYRWLIGNQTIKSVTTSNLTAENIAEGVVVQVGDSANASRITQITGTHSGGPRYTATITQAGMVNKQYITYKDVKYYSLGDTISIPANETIKIYLFYGDNTYVYINGLKVTGGYGSLVGYEYTVTSDIEISFESVSGNSYIYITEYPNSFTADQIAMRTISGNISGSTASISAYAFYGCSSLTTANFPSCTSIGNSVFYGCSGLTTASFPSCTTIGNYTFAYCSSLTTASFSLCTTIGGSTFAYCRSLTTASFPSCTTIGGSAFYSCSNLTTISFPLCKSIGSSAFYGCSGLTTASFPSCTIISTNAFYGCRSLTTANFPSCTSIGISAFYGCSGLTTASFPLCTTIGNCAFYGCSSLTTASFPLCTTIGNSAFTRCTNLTTASFSLCTSIGYDAFYNCTNLTTANFPSCTTIGNYAFRNCYSLLSLYLLGSSIPTLGNNVFILTPIDGYTTSTGGVYGSIFVPASLYDSYITATNWSLYSDRFVSV